MIKGMLFCLIRAKARLIQTSYATIKRALRIISLTPFTVIVSCYYTFEISSTLPARQSSISLSTFSSVKNSW